MRRRPNPYEKVAKIVVYEIDTTIEQEIKFYGFLGHLRKRASSYDHLAIIAFGFGRNWRDMDAWYRSSQLRLHWKRPA